MTPLPLPICAPLDHPWLLLLVPLPALIVLLWPRRARATCCARPSLSVPDAAGLQECLACGRFRLIWTIEDHTHVTQWISGDAERERARAYSRMHTEHAARHRKGRSH